MQYDRIGVAQEVNGYCVANDVSARDLQQRHGGQWFKGKCLDETYPLGPVIVTADEIPDPQTLAIRCRVNGVVKQQSNTRHQVFSVARVIAELFVGMKLLSRDVILTGRRKASALPKPRLSICALMTSWGRRLNDWYFTE